MRNSEHLNCYVAYKICFPEKKNHLMKQLFNIQITIFHTCVYAHVYTHLCKTEKVKKDWQKTAQVVKKITNIKALFIY